MTKMTTIATKTATEVAAEYENDDESGMIAELRDRVLTLEGELIRARACIATLVADDDDDDGSDAGGGLPRRSGRRTRTRTRRKSESEKNGGSSDSSPSPPVVDDVDNDSYYFTSYSHTSIHETMLRDSVRTTAYEDAISSNAKSLFENKIVLDVGCGTGVLSLFCARAGAAKVIAVDNSDVIEQAREICSLNGYDHIVTYVKGKMEDLLLERGGYHLIGNGAFFIQFD